MLSVHLVYLVTNDVFSIDLSIWSQNLLLELQMRMWCSLILFETDMAIDLLTLHQ
ncbi:hypothetical protein PGB90_005791 [Kerria lacca]